MLEALLAMGADVNTLDANGSSALDAAENANHHTTARLLQQRGACRGPGLAGAAPALRPPAHALRT
jgi:ankyrin repeat protein